MVDGGGGLDYFKGRKAKEKWWWTVKKSS